MSFNQPRLRTPGIIYPLVELIACHDAAAQILAVLVSFVNTSLLFLSTGMTGNGMLYLKAIEKTHISTDTIVFGTIQNNDTISEETDDPPYLATHCEKEKPSVQTSEKEITQETAKCREVLKQLSCLTYNIGDVEVLKELGSPLQALHRKFSSYHPTDDKVETTPFTEKKRKNEENVEKNQKNTYLYQHDEKETHLPTELASKPPSCVANILSMCQ